MSEIQRAKASASARLFSRRRFLQACAGALVAGTGTAGYGCTIGVSDLQIEQVTIAIPRLAARWDNCRLVQLSDLHHGRTDPALIQRALDMARELKPDFLLITGDFVDNKYADIESLLRMLRPMTDSIETLGCTGNHDYGREHAYVETLCERLEDTGVHMLRNRFRLADPTVREAGELCFAGVDDLWYGEFAPKFLQQAPAEAAVVFLCHNPDGYDHLPPGCGFDLMLAGHTHGGQVCVPGVGPLILPVENKSRHTGLYHPDPSQPQRAMYITRGVGHLLKIRLFCPPEVTCITLKAGEEKTST